MSTEIAYVIEVENNGTRRMFGPVIGFTAADHTATAMRELDSVSIIRVHRVNNLDGRPLAVPPDIHPDQTTIDEHLTTHIPDIHDYVG